MKQRLTTLTDKEINAIARLCHEVNRAYCKSIGDDSQPSWDDAPEWQKMSSIDGVIFNLNNPDAKPSESHECWLKDKENNGWTYGPVKDVEKKEHPCFVPYDELPEKQKTKDYIFKAVVNTMDVLYNDI